MSTKRKLIEKITEILVQSQFQCWIDKDTELTAEKVNSRKQRAIDYYLGKTENPAQPAACEQVRFHTLIDSQIAYIARLLDESDGLVDTLVGLLRHAQCPNCDGSGCIPRQVSDRRYVTSDMASDAGDPSLEGSLYSDEQWEAEQCQWCSEKDEVLALAKEAKK